MREAFAAVIARMRAVQLGAVPAAVAGLYALAVMVAQAPVAAADPRHSGTLDMSEPLQRMQRDDDQNPGMLAVAEGQAWWQRTPRAGARSCAGCHGDAARTMRGVAARYPVFEPALGRPLTLAQRIERCRVVHQREAPLAPESGALVALTAWIGMQSRGLPIAPPDDARLRPWRERGRALFTQRMGQLDLSCAQCHDARAGLSLGGAVIPQGHPTGYPLYRLEWQATGSLERRLRNCMNGVRAQPFEPGADELVALELYLMQRAAGLMIETPAVRP